MTATYNPQAAADKARATYRNVTAQLGLLGLDTAIPEAVRTVAEKTVAQSRDVYDRSKAALDASIATFEKSFDAAGQGAVAFNRKIVDVAQRNLNSAFESGRAGVVVTLPSRTSIRNEDCRSVQSAMIVVAIPPRVF